VAANTLCIVLCWSFLYSGRKWTATKHLPHFINIFIDCILSFNNDHVNTLICCSCWVVVLIIL